jgi:hypothetical protein
MQDRAPPAARINQCEEAARASQMLPQALIFTRPIRGLSYMVVGPTHSHLSAAVCADLLRMV